MYQARLDPFRVGSHEIESLLDTHVVATLTKSASQSSGKISTITQLILQPNPDESSGEILRFPDILSLSILTARS